MISLKKYLDSPSSGSEGLPAGEEMDLLALTMTAYGAALLEMGRCSQDACPGLGAGLKQKLEELRNRLNVAMERTALAETDASVQEQLRTWGHDTARHYQLKTREVKELLLVMARTAEGVGARDERCAAQMGAVTERLQTIATLDDLTEIRSSIETSAAELKSSIERMTAEGKAAVEQLRAEVSSYQARLEEAEEQASRDALTGLRNRLCVETMLENRLATGSLFCVAIVDIDGFKQVNDQHGHLAGDDLLRQFAGELRSACRSSDVIGRWGGDEFILLLDYGMTEAHAQAERLRKWVCGNYTLEGPGGGLKLRVEASIGLAERVEGETMKELLARADAAMYACKAAGRGNGAHR